GNAMLLGGSGGGNQLLLGLGREGVETSVSTLHLAGRGQRSLLESPTPSHPGADCESCKLLQAVRFCDRNLFQGRVQDQDAISGLIDGGQLVDSAQPEKGRGSHGRHAQSIDPEKFW